MSGASERTQGCVQGDSCLSTHLLTDLYTSRSHIHGSQDSQNILESRPQQSLTWDSHSNDG